MKKVEFDLNRNKVYTTYNSMDYDRSQIDHVVYRRGYNRVSNEEMKAIYITLDMYKLYEMPVNKHSLHNNSYQARFISII